VSVEPDIRVGRWLLLREAFATVKASHDIACECLVCRAYSGDDEAVVEVWEKIGRGLWRDLHDRQ